MAQQVGHVRCTLLRQDRFLETGDCQPSKKHDGEMLAFDTLKATAIAADPPYKVNQTMRKPIWILRTYLRKNDMAKKNIQGKPTE